MPLPILLLPIHCMLFVLAFSPAVDGWNEEDEAKRIAQASDSMFALIVSKTLCRLKTMNGACTNYKRAKNCRLSTKQPAPKREVPARWGWLQVVLYTMGYSVKWAIQNSLRATLSPLDRFVLHMLNSHRLPLISASQHPMDSIGASIVLHHGTPFQNQCNAWLVNPLAEF